METTALPPDNARLHAAFRGLHDALAAEIVG